MDRLRIRKCLNSYSELHSWNHKRMPRCLGSFTCTGKCYFWWKLLSNALLLLLVELASLPVFGVFYDIPWLGKLDSLLPVLVLGTWSITAVGTIFSAITAGNRLRELMLPLLVFPITLPVLMACVKVTTLIFTGEPLGESIVWLKLLIVFAVIFTLLGAVLLEAVLLAWFHLKKYDDAQNLLDSRLRSFSA